MKTKIAAFFAGAFILATAVFPAWAARRKPAQDQRTQAPTLEESFQALRDSLGESRRKAPASGGQKNPAPMSQEPALSTPTSRNALGCVEAGAHCNGSWECCSRWCDNGYCHAAGGQCVGAGAHCNGGWECCSGWCDNGYCHATGGQCAGAGAHCNGGWECCSRWCDNQYCRAAGGECIKAGYRCQGGWECCSRWCDGGYCRAILSDGIGTDPSRPSR